MTSTVLCSVKQLMMLCVRSEVERSLLSVLVVSFILIVMGGTVHQKFASLNLWQQKQS